VRAKRSRSPGAPTLGGVIQRSGAILALAAAVAVLAVAAVASADTPATTNLGNLQSEPVEWWQRATSFLGIFALAGIGWLLSTNRKVIPWRVIGWGIGLQVAFGVIVLRTDVGRKFFDVMNDAIVGLLGFTKKGTDFVFGDLATKQFTFAINVLSTIIFFSSLMAVLYHLGVMERIVMGFSRVMQKTMKTSGAETLSCAINIFVGQTEAPLVVKPFIARMTRSELMAVMVGGFANSAGGVMAAYVGLLQAYFPDIAGHLLAVSIMSAPASLVMAKIMVPETEESETAGQTKFAIEKIDANVIDAAARGAGEGLQLALNVAAMLLAFIALVAVANYLISVPTQVYNWALGLEGAKAYAPIALETILGYVFSPIAFLMGVEPSECFKVGSLLGEKTVLNEFVAYAHLAKDLSEGVQLSHRSVIICTYALCGFANFSSIAIQLGGIGVMAPNRRADLARLGLRAMIGGTLATCMTAAVAGVLV
jgi:CNT family concentrative nucleoside transporter